MREDLVDRSIFMPVQEQQNRKGSFQKGAREKEKIPRDGDPYDAADLAVRADL